MFGELGGLHGPHWTRTQLESNFKLHKRSISRALHICFILFLAANFDISFEASNIAVNLIHGHGLLKSFFFQSKLILNDLHGEIDQILVLPEIQQINYLLLLILLIFGLAILQASFINKKNHGNMLCVHCCTREFT